MRAMHGAPPHRHADPKGRNVNVGEQARVTGTAPMRLFHLRKMLGDKEGAADVKCAACQVSEMAVDVHFDEAGGIVRLVCARCGAPSGTFAVAE